MENDRGPLLYAARTGNYGKVRELIDKGVDATAREGLKALLCAARNGHGDIAQLLIEHGASVEAAGLSTTPLILAATYGHTSVVQLVIDKGASLDATDLEEDTALHGAARKGHADIAQLLIEHGASVEATDALLATPLIIAATKGRTSVVQLLIDKGASVDATDMEGNTALHCAASNERVVTAQLLIACGASMTEVNEHGHTPVSLVVKEALELDGDLHSNPTCVFLIDAMGARGVPVGWAIADPRLADECVDMGSFREACATARHQASLCFAWLEQQQQGEVGSAVGLKRPYSGLNDEA